MTKANTFEISKPKSLVQGLYDCSVNNELRYNNVPEDIEGAVGSAAGPTVAGPSTAVAGPSTAVAGPSTAEKVTKKPENRIVCVKPLKDVLKSVKTVFEAVGNKLNSKFKVTASLVVLLL